MSDKLNSTERQIPQAAKPPTPLATRASAIRESLAKLFRREEKIPFNTALEGTFKDEMNSSYIQLTRLDIPYSTGIIAEPERPVVAVRSTPKGNVKVTKFNDYQIFTLYAQASDDFAKLIRPVGVFNHTLELQQNITGIEGVNLYGGFNIQTCFFACTRDGRIFVNNGYLQNSPETVSPDGILSALRRMRTAFDSEFSTSGKNNDLCKLQSVIDDQ